MYKKKAERTEDPCNPPRVYLKRALRVGWMLVGEAG